MGFLRRLFGSKKVTVDTSDSANDKEKKRKKKNKAKRWGFASSDPNDEARGHETLSQPNAFAEPFDANKHAIAVAAATAAVAEAALAAAHAAAEVVRLTSGGASQVSTNRRRVEEIAAIRIQSAFRGYLARRALRALKALVKLQSLVRGHIVRKQTTDMLRRMQTLVRVQARVRASRSNPSESTRPTNKSSHFRQHGHRNEYQLRGRNSKTEGLLTLKRCGSNSVIDADKSRVGSSWLDSWMEENVRNNRQEVSLKNLRSEDEKMDKILEVDTWKPHYNSGQVNRTFKTSRLGLNWDHNDTSFTTVDSPSKYSTKNTHSLSSLSSAEVTSLSSLKCQNGRDEAVNSPYVQSTSSRPESSSRSMKGPFTPSRSECSWGYLVGHPNYMSNTKSSRAKVQVRSQSAPRQRLEFDKYGASRGVSHDHDHNWDTRSYSNLRFAQELNYANNAYSAASQLNRVASASKLR